ncbi:MAG: MBL fold metallo-hydrolase [Acidobacteriia bacterium]|nr:MBL fold metallo-hydrolase [Terriglobia bacterium]
MADRSRSVPQNARGAFFVDSTCIDCDTCRQLAPATFADAGDHSFVRVQPRDNAEQRAALRALLSCPTASIGTSQQHAARAALQDFPLQLEENVFYCGFNSHKSYGGNSYFVERPEGNWMIDSPRYVEQLARQFEQRGGLRYIFLTHRDDVADAEKWAARFQAVRIIHRLELAAQPAAERVLEDLAPIPLADEFLAIPTPGHTRGHTALLYGNRYLFTGDHLSWDRDGRRLTAHRDYCWHSWRAQVESLAKLRGYRFEWVLPGHGQRIRLTAAAMRLQLEELLTACAPAARTPRGDAIF